MAMALFMKTMVVKVVYGTADGVISPEDIIKIIKKYNNVLTYQNRRPKFWIISDCCGSFGQSQIWRDKFEKYHLSNVQYTFLGACYDDKRSYTNENGGILSQRIIDIWEQLIKIESSKARSDDEIKSEEELLKQRSQNSIEENGDGKAEEEQQQQPKIKGIMSYPCYMRFLRFEELDQIVPSIYYYSYLKANIDKMEEHVRICQNRDCECVHYTYIGGIYGQGTQCVVGKQLNLEAGIDY